LNPVDREVLLMKLILPALLAFVFSSITPAAVTTIRTSLAHARVLSGLEIQFQENRITVLPGVCRIGDDTVKVSDAATFTVDPADAVAVNDEEYELTTDNPDRWIAGTHLKGCIGPSGTALPNCLVPGSVIVKVSDGSAAKEKLDYRLDTQWAALSRIPTGRIGAKVRISYRIGQMRLDSIAIGKDGKVTFTKGKPARATPRPPELAKDVLRLANVFVPVGATTLTSQQILVIGDGFAEPDENLTAVRMSLVEKTLSKLRRGSPITIVAWGDSVTAGGEASTPEKAFPKLFATRLGQRFAKSKITLVNAGIGGSNTVGRLPGLYQEVLAHQPDLVTIEFVNDMELPEKTVRENLDSAFQQIRGSGAEIILITPHFTMPQMMHRDTWRGGETRPMVGVLRQIADDKAVALADVSRRWEHLEKEGLPYITLLENGINHPDDRGHELFVKELMTFFPAE
jgi:lysophospholipase L1-like esterase